MSESQFKFPRIFISHSSKDEEIAELLANLLKHALRLSAEDIRCTSVPGYKLPGGAPIDSQLREEILEADVVIGLISRISFNSAYVLFELGARWGAKSDLIPLLIPGTTPDDLQGPIKGYSPLKCDDSSQLHQLVSEVSSLIDVNPEKPEAYQRLIDNLVEFPYRSNNANDDDSLFETSRINNFIEHKKKFLFVQLFPGIGNAYFRDRYLNPPIGDVDLDGKEFQLNTDGLIFDTNSHIRYFLQYDDGSKEVEITLQPIRNVKAAYFLINSGNSKSIYKTKTVGNIILQFKDAPPLATELILGDNIREWCIGNPGDFVRDTTNLYSTCAWSGTNKDGVNAVIDCLEIPVFECMRRNELEKIRVVYKPTQHPTDDMGVHFSIFAISLELESQVEHKS